MQANLSPVDVAHELETIFSVFKILFSFLVAIGVAFGAAIWYVVKQMGGVKDEVKGGGETDKGTLRAAIESLSNRTEKGFLDIEKKFERLETRMDQMGSRIDTIMAQGGSRRGGS